MSTILKSISMMRMSFLKNKVT